MNKTMIILLVIIWACTMGACGFIGYDYGYSQCRNVKHIHIWKTQIEMLPNVDVYFNSGGVLL